MAYKMKGPSLHKGTAKHTDQLKDKYYQELEVNRELDKTSLPDGRPGVSEASPAKHNVDPHVEHHSMTGKVNTKGNKVMNENGKWVSTTKRTDLVKKGTTQIGPGGKTQNITPEETEETEETEE